MTFKLYYRVLQLIAENSHQKGVKVKNNSRAFLYTFQVFFPISQFLTEYLIVFIPYQSVNSERYHQNKCGINLNKKRNKFGRY